MSPQHHTSPSPELSLLPDFLIQWKELPPMLQAPSVEIQASAHCCSSPHPTDRVHVTHTSSLSHSVSPLLTLPSGHYHLLPRILHFLAPSFQESTTECLIPLLKSLFVFVPHSWDSPNTSPCCLRPQGLDLGPPLQHHLSPEPLSWPAPHRSALPY